jgi:hypothetical protein
MVILIIGIIIGRYSRNYMHLVKLLNDLSLSLDKKVNIIDLTSVIVDLLSIIITVAIVVSVGVKIDNRISNLRNEKDTIIIFYKEYCNMLKNKVDYFMTNEADIYERSYSFKLLRIRLSKLNRILDERGYANIIEGKLLFLEVTNLWKVFTDENSYEDNKLKLESKGLVEQALAGIDGFVYDIVLKINSKDLSQE